MGNLFSESNESKRSREFEEARIRQIEEFRRREAEAVQRRFELEQTELRRQAVQQYRERQRQLAISSLRYLDASRARVYNSENTSRVQRSSDRGVIVVNYIVNHDTISNWAPMDSRETVKYVNLLSNSQEYMDIARMFRSTNKKFFKVSHIERIQNPYLYGAYSLKKEELTSRHRRPEEQLLFHGTKEQNVDNICEDNFDWRQHGKGTGNRFGRGVSFSPISNYATHYCDKYSNIKVMLVVKVLISRSCIGHAQMDIPPNGFDTTQKDNGHVIVKYDDNEFYPAYKLYFTKGVVVGVCGLQICIIDPQRRC